LVAEQPNLGIEYAYFSMIAISLKISI